MTDLSALVADLTRLQAAATPAPWEPGLDHVLQFNWANGDAEMLEADAALIVASRNALPHLLARLAQLEAVAEIAQGFSARYPCEDECHHMGCALSAALARLDSEETP